MRGKKKSLAMLVISMVIYGSIGLFRRSVSLPSAALACYRGLAGAVLLVLLAKAQGKTLFHRIGLRKLLGLAVSGAMMGFNWIFLFEAYNYTSVGTATLCYYMQPAIVILLSPLVFKERMTVRKALCVLLSVIGMILISGVAETGLPRAGELKGILFGLAAAVLYAGVIIMNKKLPGIDAYEKTVLQLLSAGLVLLPYVLAVDVPFAVHWTPGLVFLLLVIGLVHTGLAYVLYFGSMDGLPAQTVAIFSYLDPITALILAAVLLGERMTGLELLGAALVLGAALLSEVRSGRERRAER